MINIIEFVDFNSDGCGTDIRCLFSVNMDFTFGDYCRLQAIVSQIKEEKEDWNFDEVVSEACEKYFGPLNIDYNFVSPSATIEL